MLTNDKGRQLSLIRGDHNAPRDNLLLAFFKNFFVILLGLGILAAILISSANLIIDILPYSLDRSIQTNLQKINFTKSRTKGNEIEAYLSEIVNKLKRHHEHLQDIDFQIIYDKSKDINAYAIPGDKILVTRGLWETVKSENELAMVLAHELGHFKLRHHLKAYGRLGIIMFLMIPFTGQDLGAELIQMILDNVVSGYQRQQEISADDFGLFLMQKEYGKQSAGLTSFFEKLSKKENFATKLLSHNSTHPSSEKRLKIIKDKINNLGFELGVLTPLKNIKKD
ncbi:MAG: M48 family metallopeptidase [bacterium]|nr:M48 family metallopeptidase [bacterium]